MCVCTLKGCAQGVCVCVCVYSEGVCTGCVYVCVCVCARVHACVRARSIRPGPDWQVVRGVEIKAWMPQPTRVFQAREPGLHSLHHT